MASLLRQIVAGPRSRHPEAGLDLCYVTDNIIATSGPSSTYPQRAYRNPTDALVKYLDYKHSTNWAIWEFRAEGTGYPDSEVYNRIRHYPWPDHHPPPFALIPNIIASMRDWLRGSSPANQKVIVVHCKAGKGRSGTVACSYLISEEGWAVEDALARFTARRMRSGFGDGVSIPSQLRWVGYVDWWSKHSKIYVERQVEVVEVHVWGLRDGVKVAIEGYIDEGKIIKTFHTFSKHERILMGSDVNKTSSFTDGSNDINDKVLPLTPSVPESPSTTEIGANAVMFRPAHKLVLPTSDVNIGFERHNKATYGFTMVTSVAHVWFNAFFESQHPSTSSSQRPAPASNPINPPADSSPSDSGVFSVAWEDMDGIKGSARKGTRALDRLAVVWRVVPDPQHQLSKTITEPAVGETIPDVKPADWTKAHQQSTSTLGNDLGLRTGSSRSANESRVSSIVDGHSPPQSNNSTPAKAGVQSHNPGDEGKTSHPTHTGHPTISISGPSSLDGAKLDFGGDGPAINLGSKKVKNPSPSPGMIRDAGKGKDMNNVDNVKSAGTGDLKTAKEHVPGQILKNQEPLSS